MATTLEIVRAISQVIGNSYDGALDENGDPIKIGLKREEGHPITDSRVMDGFKVSFSGDTLRIHYHSEISLKEVHDKNFENDISQTVADIANYLKKEYKKVTGSALKLTPLTECDINIQSMSRIRNWIQCQQDYKIGGVSSVGLDTKPEYREQFKRFNALAGTARPSNDTRKQPVRPGLGETDS